MIKQNAELNNQVEIAFSQKCHCGWGMKGLHSSAPQEQTHQGLLQHLLTVFFSGTCNEHMLPVTRRRFCSQVSFALSLKMGLHLLP